MKLCLVSAWKCGTYPPLNLAQLAGSVRAACPETEIKIVDAACTEKPLGEIVDFGPDIVGFTSLSPFMLDVYKLLREVRFCLGNRPLAVCGGVHASIAPSEVLLNGFDVAVVGEGENALIDIIRNDGCAPRQMNGRIIENLDYLPFPARDLLSPTYHDHYYVMRGVNSNGVYTVHGSRGCPYKCVFCCSNHTLPAKVRYRSPEHILDEIEGVVEQYGAKWIFFTDDNFLVNKEWTQQVASEFVRRGLHRKVGWEVQVRSNLVRHSDLNLIEWMYYAGCRQFDFGLESGNQRMLTFIKGEGITVGDHERALSLTKRARIKTMGTFIVGTPTETIDELGDTEQFIIRNYDMLDRFQVGTMQPYPGTRIYEIAQERGLIPPCWLTHLADLQSRGELVGGDTIYCDTIPADTVRAARLRLNMLSLKKVGFGDRMKWAAYNLRKNPKSIVDGAKWVWGNLKGRKAA